MPIQAQSELLARKNRDVQNFNILKQSKNAVLIVQIKFYLLDFIIKKFGNKKKKYNMVSASKIATQQQQKIKIINQSTVKLHAFLRKFCTYILTSEQQQWRGDVMTFQNCPRSMKLMIGGKIKKKKELNSLFTNVRTILPFVYEEKKYLATQIQQIWLYLNNNQDRSKQETSKMVYLLNKYKGVIPHLFRRSCHGLKDISPQLANFYNKAFENFLGDKKFAVQLENKDNLNVQQLMRHEAKKKIEDKQEQRYMQTKTKEEWEQIRLNESKLILQFSNYNTKQFCLFKYTYENQDIADEELQINLMLKFRDIIEVYLHQYGFLITGERKNTSSKYKFIKISTEILIQQEQQQMMKRQQQRVTQQQMQEQMIEVEDSALEFMQSEELYMDQNHLMAAFRRAKVAETNKVARRRTTKNNRFGQLQGQKSPKKKEVKNKNKPITKPTKKQSILSSNEQAQYKRQLRQQQAEQLQFRDEFFDNYSKYQTLQREQINDWLCDI